MEWDSWQLNKKLPNTEPYSPHYGINFGCFKCGSLVVIDDEIAMIHHGSVWTKSSVDFVSFEKENPKFDSKLNKQYYFLKCEGCDQNVGVYYFEGEKGSNSLSLADDKSVPPLRFPCAKIYYLRRTENNQLFHKTILLGEQFLVEESLYKLTLSKRETKQENPATSPTTESL